MTQTRTPFPRWPNGTALLSSTHPRWRVIRAELGPADPCPWGVLSPHVGVVAWYRTWAEAMELAHHEATSPRTNTHITKP